MSNHRSSVMRRYTVRLAIATTAYLATLLLAKRLVGDGLVTGPLAYLLAILPGLAVSGIFWAVARLLIEETDEYQRMLRIREALVATGFTLSILTIWTFMQNFGLAPTLDAFYIAALWFIGLGLGGCWNSVTTARTSDDS